MRGAIGLLWGALLLLACSDYDATDLPVPGQASSSSINSSSSSSSSGSACGEPVCETAYQCCLTKNNNNTSLCQYLTTNCSQTECSGYRANNNCP